jgi:PAS domain S-box-containing protein
MVQKTKRSTRPKKVIPDFAHAIHDREMPSEYVRNVPWTASDQYFRVLVQNSSEIISVLDAQAAILYASPSFERILVHKVEQITGKDISEFIHPVDLAKFRRSFQVALHHKGISSGSEFRFHHADGSWIYLESTCNNMLSDPLTQGMVVNFRDVTERMHSERLQKTLYQIAEKANTASDLQDLFAAIHQILGGLMYARNCFIALYDPVRDMIDFPYFVDERDPSSTPTGHRSRKSGKGLTEYVMRSGKPLLLSAEGIRNLVAADEVELIGPFSLDWLGVPLKIGDRCFGVLVLQAYEPARKYGEKERDILTFVSQQIANAIEHRRNQDALRKSESSYRNIFESVVEGIFQTTLDGRWVTANPGLANILGYDSTEDLMQNLNLLELYVDPNRRDQIVAELDKQDELVGLESEVRRKDGSIIWILENVHYVRDTEGALSGFVGTVQDITDRKRAEQLQAALYRIADKASAAEDLRALYQSIHEILSELMYAKNFYIALYDSSKQTLMFPYAVDEIDTFPDPSVTQPLGKGLTEYVIRTGQPLLATPETFKRLEQLGEVVEIGADSLDWLGVPLKFGSQCFGVLVLQTYEPNIRFGEKEKEILTFVSQHIAAVIEKKRNETERHRLEEQFLQSQKMEAVGRLAGGVAHDFNNLLTVIKGYSDLIQEQLSEGDPMLAEMNEIEKAADRAAALTHQLLAFSRQQVLAPKVLDINNVVAAMEKMLHRLLGEDVELIIQLEPRLGSVKADPSQMEQVIMNLAVNARDAMPHGGRLTIRTSEVDWDPTNDQPHSNAGSNSFILLTVSDTGMGMDQETQNRIFEPFFTSKEAGKGTGLGLATVYGIVRQSGGDLSVHSEPGKGSTFNIYLPRVGETAGESGVIGNTAIGRARGTETVLLVEDEDGVRTLVRSVLSRIGYHVLEARNGGEAILACERHQGDINLLLTDVVLTQIGGHELAQRLLLIRPTMKVLYMSGYTQDAVLRRGVMTAEANFIQKPFSAESLSQKVREVLDESLHTQPRS